MLIIKMPREYDPFFSDVLNQDSEAITMSYSKNFSGGKELVEIVVTLSPIILPSLIITLKAILKHIQEMKRMDKENPDEVTIRTKKSDIEIEVILKSSDVTKESNIDELVDKIIKKATKKQ